VTLNGAASAYITAATSNRLTAITNPARSLGYDNAGNTTADTGSGYTAAYDLAGRMASLTKAGITTTYSYNTMGQRVRKFGSSGPSSTVVFAYDQGGQLLGEYDQSGAAIREYVWLGSTPIAMFTPDPANAANPPLVYYIHADHLDAPRIVVDRSDNLRWRWMAEPFGTTAPENNPSGLGVFTFNLRFPGQYFDQESGLQDNWHRSYDSTLGRYTAPDPLGLAGGDVSLYSYVNGQPTEYTDPEGLNPALALYRAGMTGYRIGQAIEPWVAPYLAAAIDAVFLPDPMNENLILAQNNKQIRKRIAGLEKHIEIHKKKLDQEPDCDAANHWRNEIKAAENEIARLRLRLPNGK
jgi:RHS repeat-associated protein